MAREFKEVAKFKTNHEKYSENYDRIFGNKEEKMSDMENRASNQIDAGLSDREKLEAQLKEANEVIGFYGDKNGEHWAACRDEDTAETCCHMIAEVSGGKRAREYLDKHKIAE